MCGRQKPRYPRAHTTSFCGRTNEIAIDDTDTFQDGMGVAEHSLAFDNDDVALASAPARDALDDALQIIFGIAEQAACRMLEGIERVTGVGDPAHCEMRSRRGVDARDGKVVEPHNSIGTSLKSLLNTVTPMFCTSMRSPIRGMTPMQGPC